MPTAYITAPPEAAEDLAETPVAERLAACVNRVDCRAVDRWEGEVVTDEASDVLDAFADWRAESVD